MKNRNISKELFIIFEQISVHTQKVLPILFFFALQLYALPMQSQEKTITLKVNEKGLKEVFKEIEKQTGHLFHYAEEDVAGKKVTTNISSEDIHQALSQILRNSGLTYSIEGRYVTISKSNVKKQGQNQPTVTVSGVVYDSSDEPLIGVTVLIPQTNRATITDIDGRFKLQAEVGNVLELSYVGYKKQTHTIKGSQEIRITLMEDAQMLDEVVAIGYGTMKRKDVTGSIASIGGESLASVPVTSPLEAMSGKLAGVRVTIPEGNPDADVIIRVRGGGSITSDNTPLFIVDGFPVNSISDIPSTDIESINVLKDASSTAIYGSRGANGIILVTTKSGKDGKLSVNYNAYYGIKNAAEKMSVLDPHDYLLWQYELHGLRNITHQYEEAFGSFADIEKYRNVKGADWQDQVFGRTGHTSNQNISLSGGSEKMRFNFSYGHVDDKAILEMSKYKRDNFSLKTSYEPNKKLKMDFSIRYAVTKAKGDGLTGGTGGIDEIPSNSFGRIKHSVIQTPIDINYNYEDIDPDELTNNGLTNPMIALKDNYKERERRNYNMNASLAWSILPELVAKSEMGLDEYRNELKTFYGATTSESKSNALPQFLGAPLTHTSSVFTRTVRNVNTLDYNFKRFMPEGHSLSLLAGQEVLITESDKISTRNEGFPLFFDADMAFKFSGESTPVINNHYYYPDDKLVSFFARASYDYQSKYLFTGTFRTDGSSKFSRGNRWGYFPSAALAWRISEEQFMQTEWLDNLKLRLSYGISGNNNIPSGQTRKTFGVAAQKPWLEIADTWWTAGTILDNPDLKWESTHSLNLGVDFAVFGSRLNGAFEFYKNNTKDLLLEFTIMGAGYNTQYRNVGETQNKGFEATLNYTAVNKKDFGLDFSFVIGFNKNKIKNLGSLTEGYTKATSWQNTEVGADYVVRPGKSVGQMYGFVTDGRYEVSDFEGFDGTKWILKPDVADATDIIGPDAVRPGGLKLKKMDDSGNNRISESDKAIIGDANPLHTGGFTINARYKQFDLSGNFTWSYGNDIYNADKIEFTSPTKYEFRNMNTIMASGSRWTNLGADGSIVNDPELLKQMNASTTMWSPFMNKSVFHSWAVEDGSFLRLSTLTLGYTVPKVWTKKAHIQHLRVYLTGYNLFCLTNYSGFDPEVDTRRNYRVTPGVDYSAYPKSRQYIIGLNLTL